MVNRQIRTICADTWFARLIGMIGTNRSVWENRQLLIVPCKAIHTFGMGYALDVAFIDCDGKILTIHHAVKPGRILRGPHTTMATIERPAQEGSWYRPEDRCEDI